jgi:beta-glucosidase
MTEKYPYQDPTLPIPERVVDLLGRMTLVEKVAQLYGMEPPEDEDGRFSLAAAREKLSLGVSYVGSFNRKRDTAETIAYLNAVQKFLMEETRLGIPALVFGEGLHGFMAQEATSFPQAIGLASTWDPELHERIFSVVAREMRVRGAQYVLSPVLDLARDPRWGRTEETYGEDPYLASRMGVAAVRGLQGERFSADADKVLATAKHYAAHGQPEGGTNAAPANYAERILREEFLIPFQAAVEEGGIGSVMASYNEINGVPSHINPWLLKEVLRDEWGFEGLVVSDGWGVDDLYRLHFVASDAADAARQAFLSGIEVELGRCFVNLVEEVRVGRVPEERVDQAVARVLTLKFQFGLFENPYADAVQAVRVTNCEDHKALALEAAHKAIVLLKNEGDLLPLNTEQLQSLAVIGPNAAAVRLGGYSGDPGCVVTVLEGIRQKVGGKIEVRYAEGCGITQSDLGPAMWHEDLVVTPDPAKDQGLIAEAVEIARGADVALLVLGDNEQTCREGWSETHLGDRDSLDLPGSQEELLRAVVETGTPTILLLIQGRPATINYAADHVPAILEGWYLGQAAGVAVADVLFGDINPGGKLPITFPRSVGQLPAYYYHKPSARRGYLFADKTPLFPFGHGLSYTNFEFSNLRLEPQQIKPGENAVVSVDVTNAGQCAGDEVVQLYLRDQVSSLTRPVKQLKAFQRITLEPGETQTAAFTLKPEALSFLNAEMQRVVEPGLFDVMVGNSSVDVQTVVLEVLDS